MASLVKIQGFVFVFSAIYAVKTTRRIIPPGTVKIDMTSIGHTSTFIIYMKTASITTKFDRKEPYKPTTFPRNYQIKTTRHSINW